uniref:Uncharacterized protein n=1 Tax=Romanomermis culicivorax TaxID=13658 RepID=A0A915J5G6_ROMCU
MLKFFLATEKDRDEAVGKKINIFNIKLTLEKPREPEFTRILQLGDITGPTIPKVISHDEVEHWLIEKFPGIKIAADNDSKFATIPKCKLIKCNLRMTKIIVPRDYTIPGYVWCQTTSMIRPINLKQWYHQCFFSDTPISSSAKGGLTPLMQKKFY